MRVLVWDMYCLGIDRGRGLGMIRHLDRYEFLDVAQKRKRELEAQKPNMKFLVKKSYTNKKPQADKVVKLAKIAS